MTVETDPKLVREIAEAALRSAMEQRRDVSVGIAIYDRDGTPLSQDAFRALHDAVAAEYDRLAAVAALQEADARAVRAVVDAAGRLPILQYESMPELAEALNALLVQFEDRIKAIDAAESLARMQNFRADQAVNIHIANLNRRYEHNDGSMD